MNVHGQRDHPGAEEVWRDLHGPLLAFISRRVSDRDSADDILQDVMLRIHRHAGELRSAPAVGGWIHQIARNTIIDHYRRAAVRRERPVGSAAELDRPTPTVPEPGPAELRVELTACLEPLLAQLPAIYRDALRLTDLDGLTQADAAARIGLSTSGMKPGYSGPAPSFRRCSSDAARSSSTDAAASSTTNPATTPATVRWAHRHAD